ncbi:hypothetical protein WG66_003213 [Moniliophthora roreri]|nr:hypothetical protein WG66_003213 [Moniliophthora roreri]
MLLATALANVRNKSCPLDSLVCTWRKISQGHEGKDNKSESEEDVEYAKEKGSNANQGIQPVWSDILQLLQPPMQTTHCNWCSCNCNSTYLPK